jgi:hypothetical protein
MPTISPEAASQSQHAGGIQSSCRAAVLDIESSDRNRHVDGSWVLEQSRVRQSYKRQNGDRIAEQPEKNPPPNLALRTIFGFEH